MYVNLPNPAAPVNAPVAPSFQVGHRERRVTEPQRSAAVRIGVGTIMSLMICGCMSRPPGGPHADGRILAPGECVNVQAVRDHRVLPELQTHRVIDSTGNVELPFLGLVPVAGLTLAEANERIERQWHQAPQPIVPAHRTYVLSWCGRAATCSQRVER
jgi:protein involved in polysaccharide export with SLBB domain